MLFITNRYISPIFTSTRKFLKSSNITFLHCIKIPFDSAQGDSKRVDFAQEGSTQGDCMRRDCTRGDCSQEGSVLSLARIPISYRYIFMILVCLFTNILTFAQDDTLTAGITEEEKHWIIDKTVESLVFVEGGTFMLGDVGYDSAGVHYNFNRNPNARPAHQVTLDSYSIQKYEVTYKEFDLFCKATGRELVASNYIGSKRRAENLSAWHMNWYEARAYCQWTGALIGVPMDLASNAQWEYAARSRGRAVKFATDNGKIEPGRNYADASVPYYGTSPGTYPPNPLGIYDMAGGNPEWVLDYLRTYRDEKKINPVYIDPYTYITIRGYDKGMGAYYSLYSRGQRFADNTGSGMCIRCVANSKKPVIIPEPNASGK